MVDTFCNKVSIFGLSEWHSSVSQKQSTLQIICDIQTQKSRVWTIHNKPHRQENTNLRMLHQREGKHIGSQEVCGKMKGLKHVSGAKGNHNMSPKQMSINK